MCEPANSVTTRATETDLNAKVDPSAMVEQSAMTDLWVFAYGSLMWRPGFDFADCIPAILKGRHRALCIYSHVHRGTREQPGLVLGLDRGGACKGLAYRVTAADTAPTLAYLRARELVTHVYRERVLAVSLANGQNVNALTYVVDTRHPQYAKGLTQAATMEHIRNGRGISGDNADYVIQTHTRLQLLGVRDARLAAIVTALTEPA